MINLSKLIFFSLTFSLGACLLIATARASTGFMSECVPHPRTPVEGLKGTIRFVGPSESVLVASELQIQTSQKVRILKPMRTQHLVDDIKIWFLEPSDGNGLAAEFNGLPTRNRHNVGYILLEGLIDDKKVILDCGKLDAVEQPRD